MKSSLSLGSKQQMTMRICIVGAGAAGLCAIKHSLAHKCDVIAFELTDKIGGTWVYTDDVGRDKFGNGIHSSMYQNLRTNLPKELMAFPDLPFPPSRQQQHEQSSSFVASDDVNNYLNLYADQFALRPHIKFSHAVHRIVPLVDGKWEIVVKRFNNNATAGCDYETFIFDAVLVCNGHNATPNLPKFAGLHTSGQQRKFHGAEMHSHDYRKPEKFNERKVLVVGGGPSAVDISQDIAKCASVVFWSSHTSAAGSISTLMENLIAKPDVGELIENEVVFVDGTKERVDDVVYCTGYQFTFPFLSADCGLATDENYVRPLYKHCLNINHPTMALIGLPGYVAPFQMFDLQIRFVLTFMTGRKSLPSTEHMLADMSRDMTARWSRGLARRKAHALGKDYQDLYFAELAATAGMEPVKPVILAMYNRNSEIKTNDFANYRKYQFTVLNDEDFVAEIKSSET